MYHVLPIRQIVPDPEQPRREMESPDEVNEARTLAGLAQSIEAFGILQPIRVRAIGSDRYQIISGERRFKAASLAGLLEVPVLVVEHTEVLLEQIIENVQRKAMTPLELADAIQLLLAQGLESKTIASKLGMNASQITILSQLKTVSPVIREALESRLIGSPRAAYDLNKLPPALQHQLIDQARTKGVTIGQQDVKAAKKSRQTTLPAYAAPKMANSEVIRLQEVLNQHADAGYDPVADRAAIAGVTPTLTHFSTDTVSYNDYFLQQNQAPALSKAQEAQDFWDQMNGIGVEADEGVSVVRIPAFTLNSQELKVLAERYFKETPPEGLADPGGWLVDCLKRYARQ